MVFDGIEIFMQVFHFPICVFVILANYVYVYLYVSLFVTLHLPVYSSGLL